ncbi:ubiquinone biosynthesis O-methyltransferase, mitochondrial [Schistocerca americana]|uniref:ubiquinone biosynthesis O-methyltransferase, mitochondrial n=1 Tax=Schistocerca americana TaxID=7009 RepID=UPI001F4F6F0E|nr:ubiquinone biosynthesis O-methyltransferase, mitochondrial [Schistocerca americana]
MFKRSVCLARGIYLPRVYMCTNPSTVSDNEMRKFKELANQWWDANGPLKPLHSFNSIRVPFIVNGLAAVNPSLEIESSLILKDLKILDVGCGAGVLSEQIARMGAMTTAVDPCSDIIAAAQSHLELDENLKTLTYLCSTIEEIAEKEPEYYDAVIASEVAEHATDYKVFVSHCCKALKPGGSIFITTVNRTLVSRVFGIWAAEYVFGILPKGTHEWEKFITPTELERSLEDNGCVVKSTQGALYNILNNSWYSCPSQGINYFIHAVKHKDQDK